MSRQKKPAKTTEKAARVPRQPSYLKHRGPDGRLRARVRIDGRDVPLGPYKSQESYDRYDEEIARWKARQAAKESGDEASSPTGPVRTVADLVARFLVHARATMIEADGRPKQELANYTGALAPLLRVYGPDRVKDFGPPKLKALRRVVADGSWLTDEERNERQMIGGRARQTRWSRRVINRNMVRIKTVFGWAVSEGLIDGSIYHALLAVKGLKRKELPGVRELPKVKPVPEAALEATLSHLYPVHRAMVLTQLLTGARPGEVCRLRPCDLQRTELVEIDGTKLNTRGCWVLILDPEEDPEAEHKTSYLGHRRIILFGPRAQEVLAPYLVGRASDAPLFSPREAMAAWRAGQRARRKTRVQPSQASRSKAVPLKGPGDVYDTRAYAQAVGRAIERANAAGAKAKPPRAVVPHWHPNQLRHNAGTRLVDQFGWDVARIVLGHTNVKTTQVYALDAIQKAVDAVGKVG